VGDSAQGGQSERERREGLEREIGRARDIHRERENPRRRGVGSMRESACPTFLILLPSATLSSLDSSSLIAPIGYIRRGSNLLRSETLLTRERGSLLNIPASAFLAAEGNGRRAHGVSLLPVPVPRPLSNDAPTQQERSEHPNVSVG